MLLYPVYTLLFSDAGLSVWQISSLFVIWSVSSLVLEVPSGALSRHPIGVVALGAAFGTFQLATDVVDTRLQEAISGPARATVTSLAGMSTDVVTLGVYGSYAALAEIGGHPGAFTILMLPYALVAVTLAASSWRRAASRRRMAQTKAR